MIRIDLCSSGPDAVRSDKAGKQSESHKDSRRYCYPPEYLLLSLSCVLYLQVKLCTFYKPMNGWTGIEFVFGLTRVGKADRVCLQELLQLWKGFPRAAGKRHETEPLLGSLTQGLEYLITVRGLHGHDALLLPVTFKFLPVLSSSYNDAQRLSGAFNCLQLLSVTAGWSCRQPFVHDQRIDIP